MTLVPSRDSSGPANINIDKMTCRLLLLRLRQAALSLARLSHFDGSSRILRGTKAILPP
jgi:hypothetical protein